MWRFLACCRIAIVWYILTDFATYRRWNPTVSNVLGTAKRGNTILVTQRRGCGSSASPRSSGGRTVQRTVKHVREPRELYWLGKWASASVFACERRFRIESLPEGPVRFHQCERFGGAAVPMMWAGLRRDLPAAFRAMNDALKQRAERSEAELARRTQPGLPG